jgi:hypothetical protein
LELGPHRNLQRGGSKLSFLITMVILCSIGFAMFKIAPPYMDKFQLQDELNSEVHHAMANRSSQADIQANIMKYVKEHDLPITPNDVQVIAAPNSTTINVHYIVPVDLKVLEHDFEFTLTANSQAY